MGGEDEADADSEGDDDEDEEDDDDENTPMALLQTDEAQHSNAARCEKVCDCENGEAEDGGKPVSLLQKDDLAEGEVEQDLDDDVEDDDEDDDEDAEEDDEDDEDNEEDEEDEDEDGEGEGDDEVGQDEKSQETEGIAQEREVWEANNKEGEAENGGATDDSPSPS